MLGVELADLPNIVEYVREFIGNFYNTEHVGAAHLHIDKFTYLIEKRVVAMLIYPTTPEWEQILLAHGNGGGLLL